MIFRQLVLTTVLFTAFMAIAGAQEAPTENTISLFDGKTLDGWVTLDGEPITRGWEVVDGTIHVTPAKERPGHIRTTQTFENFVLEFEWRIAAGGNSGVKYLLKQSNSAKGLLYYGCEYQLLDDKKHKNGRTPTKTAGALYDLFAPDTTQKELKPIDEFNHSKIVVDNGRIEHWLNGSKVVDVTIGSDVWRERIRDSKFDTVENFANGPGAIMLQEHLSEAWFRNLQLKPLPKVEKPLSSRPNVLFIAVDDLRPELGCYGKSLVKSPNIDQLARDGMVFDRAYCQQAICMSSRASLLSGYRPDKGKIYQNGPLFKHVPDALTLNQHFLDNGYSTVCLGKIYHHSSDYNRGWSRPAFKAKDGEWKGRGYLAERSVRLVAEYTRKHPNAKRQGMGPAFEAPDVPDNAYPDGLVAERAVQELKRLKDKPFFLAVGFVRPHLPFNAPKTYWDLYDPSEFALADNPFRPKGSPKEAATGWGELRGYHGMPKSGQMPDELSRKLIHGYCASVSYTDALIGKILAELKTLELTNNTVVILWGDHGWKLGDHGMWCKHTNFEIDTHVPLIISSPGMKLRGQRCSELVELVDIYPTLCELAGLELPPHLEGRSMSELLDKRDVQWKQQAFSQYPRNRTMGYSVRTDRYRYTEWRDLQSGSIKARELYDLDVDPRSNTNVATNAEHKSLVTQLSGVLKRGFRSIE